MSKINKDFGGQCIYCKQYGAMDYSIHGSGKYRIINYFHPECYRESINTRHRCNECDYYLLPSGRCNGQKWAPEVNCNGDRNKCELKED